MRIKKELWMWFFIVSLIVPGIRGVGAEELLETQLQIIVEEDMEDLTGSETQEDAEEFEIQIEKEIEKESECVDEVIILDMEEVDSPVGLTEIPSAYESEIQEIVVEEELGWVSESGLASCAALPAFSMYAVSEYAGSYGAQLEAQAAEIYHALVDMYATKKKADILELKLQEGFKFTVTDLGYDETGERRWERDEEEFLLKKEEAAYMVQSAYDAFMYDHPEVFWFSAFTYKIKISLYRDANTGEYLYGAIRYITITPKDRYTGASAEIGAFDKAVDAAASQITGNLPQGAGTIEIIEEIHDYLCFQVSYQENAYAHTAAGVFLKGGAVVCEGYAKSFHILCSRFGIESVLIPGNALKADGSKEGHMWNYVKLNGIWYMVDATWDDQVNYVSKVYFLAGNSSKGFNEMISQERTLFTKFSGANVQSQSFVLPVLGENAYSGTWHEWYTAKTVDVETSCKTAGSKSNHCRKCNVSKVSTIEELPQLPHTLDNGSVTVEPTCSDVGQKKYVCQKCGAEEYDEIPMTDHRWETEYTIDQEPDCTNKGLKCVHCTVCDTIDEKTITELEAKGHAWDAGKRTIKPTCTTVGQLTYTCTVCKSEEYDEIAKTAHKWKKKYTIDKKPTCTRYGQKSIYCSVCDSVKEGSRKKIDRLEASFSVKSLTMQIGQKTDKLVVSGLVDGDYVKSWKSENTKIVKVDKKGKITAQKKTGKTKIIIQLANKKYGTSRKYSIPVTVRKKEIKTQKITGVEKKITVRKGKTYTLKPVLTPITSQQKLTYTSSKRSVASVSSKGVIKAKAAGKTKITVRSGTKSVTVTVTVPQIRTEKIKAQNKVSVRAGKKVKLKVTLVPAKSDQKISFTSKNKKIATVNSKGMITGKKKGKAKIVVKSGDITHVCTVTVK